MCLLTAGFAVRSFELLMAGGVIAGAGQGMSFRAGLAAVNAEAPVARRAGVASAYFVVLYVALSLPVIGVGVAADLFGLRASGIAFSLIVAALAGSVLAALLRGMGVECDLVTADWPEAARPARGRGGTRPG